MFLFSDRWLKSKMELRVAKRSGISSGILRSHRPIVIAITDSSQSHLYDLILGIWRRRTKIRLYRGAELIVWIIAAASFLPTRPAHAYIDPGSGSIIIQVIIGAFFGAAYILKRFWRNIAGWFKGRKQDKNK